MISCIVVDPEVVAIHSLTDSRGSLTDVGRGLGYFWLSWAVKQLPIRSFDIRQRLLLASGHPSARNSQVSEAGGCCAVALASYQPSGMVGCTRWSILLGRRLSTGVKP